MTSAYVQRQVIPFEQSFGAELLSILPTICVPGVYGGIKLIPLHWGSLDGRCQKGDGGGRVLPHLRVSGRLHIFAKKNVVEIFVLIDI